MFYGCCDFSAFPEEFLFDPVWKILFFPQDRKRCTICRKRHFENVFRSDSFGKARCSVLIWMCCVFASVRLSPTRLALHHHHQCGYSMCIIETSSCEELRGCGQKSFFYLNTIYFAERERHTELKLCVDRTGSIPTACLCISSMCWNGKYAIDLCALVLYCNISNEWQNKRGTVRVTLAEKCSTRRTVNFVQSIGISLFIISAPHVYFSFIKEFKALTYIWN